MSKAMPAPLQEPYSPTLVALEASVVLLSIPLAKTASYAE